MAVRACMLEELDGSILVDRAAEYVKSKMQLDSTGKVFSLIDKGNLDAYLYFRYSLAKEAAEVLGKMAKDGTKEVYLLFENQCDALPGDPMCLCVRVEKKTAALESLIQSLSEIAVAAVRKRVPALQDLEFLFHIELVDDGDMARQVGLAAALKSLHQPPLCVWP